ncbi:helix-turn-helix transcriptional regulator [Tellurirhabdus bombi]|uniref:helix-turn-helix transcriptional regulator n=1 Tax=Tellurirhabdus bombi TaxID=2907205 RepID=UPI001F270070|nr:LuxR family transcriptional regulator [Tellurirhabdus bombi]
MPFNYTRYYLLLFFFSLLQSFANGQSPSFRQLEQKVYQLNNEFKYTESQALLLPILQSDAFRPDEKYQAALLLSHTYKRVFDYESTLKFLGIARQYAEATPKKESYIATIQSEAAFAFFDTHDYKKADSLMDRLEKNNFRYISLENKSKLVMQQGYLLFLNKKYAEAEATYDKAIQWMRASTPCHLPMIYVKKMQLYDAMQRFDLLDKALTQSTHYTDSCRIIKYHLYAYEELLHIYEGRNNLPGIALVQKKLDSLNKEYARETKISSLHNQKEAILIAEKNQKLQQEQTNKKYLTLALISLLVVVAALLGWLYSFRRRQHRIEKESLRISSELEVQRSQQKPLLSAKIDWEKEPWNKLSERQQEVLECLALGMSNKMIAEKLFISENTVKYHIKNIYLLLDIKDRREFLLMLKK